MPTRSRGRAVAGSSRSDGTRVLALDLTSIEAPAVVAPDGIEIVTWAERPDATPGMYEVAKEAYPDIPGEEDAEMEPFEQWLSMDMQGAGDRPEATFVAFADDEVVAYAKLSLSLARPTVAMHDITGVKRAWRGRGIAGSAQGGGDRLGEAERLRPPRDPERGAERADPAPEPAPRLRRRARLDHGARPGCGRSDVVAEREHPRVLARRRAEDVLCREVVDGAANEAEALVEPYRVGEQGDGMESDRRGADLACSRDAPFDEASSHPPSACGRMDDERAEARPPGAAGCSILRVRRRGRTRRSRRSSRPQLRRTSRRRRSASPTLTRSAR